MSKLFPILLLLAHQSSYSQTYSSLITDKEITEFISEDILRGNVKFQIPIRQNFWLPDKEIFYYSDSADFARKNNQFPPLFIFPDMYIMDTSIRTTSILFLIVQILTSSYNRLNRLHHRKTG